MKATRTHGVIALIAMCLVLGQPCQANGGQPPTGACEVYPTRMDPTLGKWAFVTVCEAESLGPPPTLRIGTREFALEPVNTVREGLRLAVLWVVRSVVDEETEAIQLVLPEADGVVYVSRYDAKPVEHVPGELGVRLRYGALNAYPLSAARWAPPAAIRDVHVTDPMLATWLGRLGVHALKKTVHWRSEEPDEPITRSYCLRFDERVCPYAVLEILSHLDAVDDVFPSGVFKLEKEP